MGLNKGVTNNPKGRKPGSKNKVTIPVREQLNSFLINNFAEFERACQGLTDRDFVQIFRDLLKYAVPVPTTEHNEDSQHEENTLLSIVNQQITALNNRTSNDRRDEKVTINKEYEAKVH